jgi:hypothetical protein
VSAVVALPHGLAEVHADRNVDLDGDLTKGLLPWAIRVIILDEARSLFSSSPTIVRVADRLTGAFVFR